MRPLPASIELTGDRIVEQLLTVLRDEPSAQVDVSLRFAPDCLELCIAGHSGRRLRAAAAPLDGAGPARALRRDDRHR